MAPVATILSYRLGGDDGVSVEASKWSGALTELGFDVRRVAGDITDAGSNDVVLPELAIAPPSDAEQPQPAAVHDSIDGSDLVVVENLCSLPLNIGAADATAIAVDRYARRGGRVVFHHHDLPWQRRHLAHLDGRFPPRIPGAAHVTINLRSMRELASRDIDSYALHNRFEMDAAPGDRSATREALGFSDELIVLQPTRAIERKNVPGAVRYLIELSRLMPNRPMRYWLTGPAEDGYEETLDRVLDRCPVPVTTGRAASARDAYAASDLVVFPSTWEGFGNPTVESIVARRPLAAFAYPVLREITAFGIQFFSTDRPEDVVRFLARPQPQRFETNLARARKAFALSDLPALLDEIFARQGWRSW